MQERASDTRKAPRHPEWEAIVRPEAADDGESNLPTMGVSSQHQSDAIGRNPEDGGWEVGEENHSSRGGDSGERGGQITADGVTLRGAGECDGVASATAGRDGVEAAGRGGKQRERGFRGGRDAVEGGRARGSTAAAGGRAAGVVARASQPL